MKSAFVQFPSCILKEISSILETQTIPYKHQSSSHIRRRRDYKDASNVFQQTEVDVWWPVMPKIVMWIEIAQLCIVNNGSECLNDKWKGRFHSSSQITDGVVVFVWVCLCGCVHVYFSKRRER